MFQYLSILTHFFGNRSVSDCFLLFVLTDHIIFMYKSKQKHCILFLFEKTHIKRVYFAKFYVNKHVCACSKFFSLMFVCFHDYLSENWEFREFLRLVVIHIVCVLAMI